MIYAYSSASSWFLSISCQTCSLLFCSFWCFAWLAWCSCSSSTCTILCLFSCSVSCTWLLNLALYCHIHIYRPTNIQIDVCCTFKVIQQALCITQCAVTIEQCLSQISFTWHLFDSQSIKSPPFYNNNIFTIKAYWVGCWDSVWVWTCLSWVCPNQKLWL